VKGEGQKSREGRERGGVCGGVWGGGGGGGGGFLLKRAHHR